jgi:hypothetical protein
MPVVLRQRDSRLGNFIRLNIVPKHMATRITCGLFGSILTQYPTLAKPVPWDIIPAPGRRRSPVYN